MKRALRHREPSQAMALAAVSMISIVGMVAFVIDASSFFVIRREVQNAADAAALAGALYISPDTPVGVPRFPAGSERDLICSNFYDDDPMTPLFESPPYPLGLRNGSVLHSEAVQAACYWAFINSDQASRLCNTTAGFKNAYTRADPQGLPHPELVVEVGCDAQFTFGRILNLREQKVSAYAIAALGTWRTDTDQFGSWFSCAGLTWCHDASRLIPD